MEIVKQIGTLPIEERNFDYYYYMSHGGLDETDMEAYNDIQNSDEFEEWSATCFQDYNLWPGAVEVIAYYCSVGINSEEAEFMNDLPAVDAFILYKLSNKNNTD